MKVFNTANLTEEVMRTLSENEAAWIYNGLDCCVTAEVFTTLRDQLESEDPRVQETYETAFTKQAPILEMSMRGTKLDEDARQKSIEELSATLADLDKKFQRIMVEVFGGELNWRSPTQLKSLFYSMLGLKEIKKRNQKGVYAASTDREALEQLEKYFFARPLARFVLIMRDLNKQIGFLKTEIDPDGRIRTNYNVAGTNTGRLSSSMNDFGTGTNLQNVNRKLRTPFIPDRGMIFVNIDLEQADGRNVGATCWEFFYDSHGPEFAGSYLDACESGDLHTNVCRMTWPELDWPEDPAEWKSFCDSIILHGQDSYRQVAKKLGHGTNYYGTPRTMAKHTHSPIHIIEDFQRRYFAQFPCIPEFHREVIRRIEETGTLYSIFGRRKMFFGRATDARTHRQAIAYCGQSPTGDQIDRGMLRVWRRYPQVQFLGQVHDSVLMQLPYSEHVDLIPKVLETLKVTLTLKGDREFYVPLEAKVGWNWGDYNEKTNPYGLMKWKGREERQRPNPKTRLSDYL